MFRNKSFAPCMRGRQKGKGSFGCGTIKREKEKRSETREKIQINFHPENCFEIAENLFIFIRWLLYDERISSI